MKNPYTPAFSEALSEAHREGPGLPLERQPQFFLPADVHQPGNGNCIHVITGCPPCLPGTPLMTVAVHAQGQPHLLNTFCLN